MSLSRPKTLRLATPPGAMTTDPTPTRAHTARRYLQRLQAIARELYEYDLYREATDLFRYLTMVDPSNPTNWYWLGRSLVSVGDPSGAARVFELGSRISHVGHFADLAADAWRRAGCPDHAEAALALKGLAS